MSEKQGKPRRGGLLGHSAGHDIDPTFYRSPADAIGAPPEHPAHVVAFDRAGQNPDALTVLDTDPGAGGGLRLDEAFFPRGEAFRGLRAHQVRLQGGDASSDSYCYRW